MRLTISFLAALALASTEAALHWDGDRVSGFAAKVAAVWHQHQQQHCKCIKA